TTARAAGDQLTFRRPTVREDVLRRLRRGEFRAEAELDLHGMRRLDAHAALTEFLTDSIAHGLRCVRVIHGTGLRSGPEGPVLKHVVDQWLRTVENVLAFTSARAVDGGSGALYVLLAPLPRTTR
ncbi:MAG: Smr/MutS family protein, partial [Steroidobacteraceae bacterium]